MHEQVDTRNFHIDLHFWLVSKPAPNAPVVSCNAEIPPEAFAYLVLGNYWTDLMRNTTVSVVPQAHSGGTSNSHH